MAARRSRRRPLNETIFLACGHDTCMGEQNVTTLGSKPPAGKFWCESHGRWVKERQAVRTELPEEPPFLWETQSITASVPNGPSAQAAARNDAGNLTVFSSVTAGG